MPRDPRPSGPRRRRQRLSAAAHNREIESLRQGAITTVEPIGMRPFGSGTVIFLDEIPDIWAAVLSVASGVYSLKEQIPDTSGGWIDGPQTITAREINGNGSVPLGTIVRARFDRQANYWFFQSSVCT